MLDMTQTTIAKSDQLNADDLIGKSITIKITKVSIAGAAEQPIAINYEGDNGKPWFPCKGMRRVLVHIWGADGLKYVGRQLTLYRDPDVKFGGQAVGGIRISHMSNMDSKVVMALTASKANKKPYTVLPLQQASPPDPDLIEAGKTAAASGLEVFTAWGKTLTPEQKESLKPYLAGWTKEAKAVAVPVSEDIL